MHKLVITLMVFTGLWFACLGFLLGWSNMNQGQILPKDDYVFVAILLFWAIIISPGTAFSLGLYFREKKYQEDNYYLVKIGR